MPGFVDTAVQSIDHRLRELMDEVSKLEAARAALVGNRRGPARAARAATTRTRTTRSRAARRPGRPRGRRVGNTRANQALELVRGRPGITIPEIASALKIEPNYLYRVMPRLEQDGQVKKEGPGYRPVS
jgi:CRP-like cAMP-binding protein